MSRQRRNNEQIVISDDTTTEPRRITFNYTESFNSGTVSTKEYNKIKNINNLTNIIYI